MRTLTEAELLNLWEDCIDRPLIETSLCLIGAASSDEEMSGIADFSIGQRDLMLLQLREWTFGSRIENMAVCPHCAERIEWENSVNDVRLQALLPQADKIFEVEIEEFRISFRLPTSRDLLSLQHHSSQQGASELLNRCIVKVLNNNTVQATADLPINIIEQLNERMSREDPQADITMLLTCPSCSGQWESGFDILSYFWSEINSWARHMLQEIYILAKFFGWSERDILNIGPKRRRLYLEMVRA